MLLVFAGFGLGGVLGGIFGSLFGITIPEYRAYRFNSFTDTGGILMSIHTRNSDETTLVETCLVKSGAKDVTSSFYPST